MSDETLYLNMDDKTTKATVGNLLNSHQVYLEKFGLIYPINLNNPEEVQKALSLLQRLYGNETVSKYSN